MKKSVLIMIFPVVLLVMLLQLDALSITGKNSTTSTEAIETDKASTESAFINSSEVVKSAGKLDKKSVYTEGGVRENIVNYAYTLLGSPYLFAGNSKDGFDCSGFTTHVFDNSGISVKRSSGLQASEGVSIARSEAAPGDLIIFTGTDKAVREPGHVGIVISQPGDTIEFIHSSSSISDSGVKISQVEGSGYDARFLDIRRVL